MVTTRLSGKLNVIMGYMLMSILTLFTCLITRSLIVNSHFTIDFENLLVFPFSSYLYLGGIISLSLLLFAYSIKQIKWIELQKQTIGFRLFSLLASSGMVFVLLNIVPEGPSPLWTTVGISSFMLLADLFINRTAKNLTWLISWVIILSTFLSMVLFDGYLSYDLLQREKMATSLFHEKSNTAIEDFHKVKGQLISEGVFDQFLSVPFPFKIHRSEFNQVNKDILDPVAKSEYEYIFNAYDRHGNPMIYETYTALSYFEEFKKRSDAVSDDLYFDPIKNTYLSFWTHVAENHENGPFTIYLEQHPTDHSVYFASEYIGEGNLGKYDYAYYKNDRVASFSNPYTLHEEDSNIDLDFGETKLVNRSSFSDFYVQFSENKMIKLSRKSARLIKPVSLFSFIFLYISILLGILVFFNNKTGMFGKNYRVHLGQMASLQTRLQVSIISLIIFSFLVIGFITIYYFQSLSSEYDRDLVKEKAMSLVMDFQSHTKQSQGEKSMINTISKNLSSICKQHHVNINVYNRNGQLALSSFSKMYEQDEHEASLDNNILMAFAQNKDQIKLDFHSKYIGEEFQQAYFPILNEAGNIELLVHSLQVPVIKSNSKVSDFVGTLLNIYVFLFLIAGALAFGVANSITRPLKELGQKMKKVKLGVNNKPLVWETQDELGQLISNYNGMVAKLDDSAKVIAQTERDLAWREMAKQVAHEIKNPLTPMKLSIQYLQRAIDQQPERTPELVERVASTLIEQIDNLSNIAGAFSNFGKMPQADNNKVVLNEVVEAIHDLFRKRDDMDVNMYEPIDEIYIFADKNALVRVLNNIVKNAIQAIPTERRGHIDIRLYKKDKIAVIQISDNGIGISDDRKEKVFLPNFTTKSSGTGLGLAICSNMVESFNGRLYFESTEGIGTDFYIEIPLMHVNDNFEVQERVSL